MINLVSLVCNRDLRQLFIQMESIKKFVEPCKHYIIVNELLTDNQKNRWTKLLSNVYKEHELVIWFPEDINKLSHIYVDHGKSSYWGGFKYQFLVSKFLDDDYVVLNSKNFFIKPINLESWRNKIGSNKSIEFNESRGPWWSASLEFAKFFNKPPLRYVFNCETPQVVKISALREKLGDLSEYNTFWNKLVTDCYEKNLYPGDWHFYSYIHYDEIESKKQGLGDMSHFENLWPIGPDYKLEVKAILDSLDNSHKCAVVGIHRNFLSNLRADDLILLNQWLKNKGITYKLKAPSKHYK